MSDCAFVAALVRHCRVLRFGPSVSGHALSVVPIVTTITTTTVVAARLLLSHCSVLYLVAVSFCM